MIWIATIENKIVGTAAVVPNKRSPCIRSVAITPEERGNRIGERSLKEIEKFGVACKYRKLLLNTTPFLKRAIRLYKKFGFFP